MAGKEYIIPLGVDATNVINPMSQVIETMEKTENVSRGTGKALSESFSSAAKPSCELLSKIIIFVMKDNYQKQRPI